MAFKVSSSRLIKHSNLLKRSLDAIIHLELNGKNKIVYPQLKQELQDEIKELEDSYNLSNFSECKKKKVKTTLYKVTLNF